MPISTKIVGTCSEPFHCHLDRRWAMNYAAAIDDRSPILYDTRRSALPVHPLFLAHPEWESQKLLQLKLGIDPAERSRAVQVTHHTRIFRRLRAGMDLATTATVVGLERHRGGAWSTVQCDTVAADGELVARTTMAALYRDVGVDGADRPAGLVLPEGLPEGLPGEGAEPFTEILDVPSTACHVYSECAQIWNPIHTDLAVADAAGLPGLILHGTATLAKAVSAITSRLTGGDPASITSIAGQFRAMVIAPTSLKLAFRGQSKAESGARQATFVLLTESGDQAITNGVVTFGANT